MLMPPLALTVVGAPDPPVARETNLLPVPHTLTQLVRAADWAYIGSTCPACLLHHPAHRAG